MNGDLQTDDAFDADRLSTGIDGVDEILHGGFIPRRSYLVRGDPGTGKTIFGFHFLTAGVAAGETTLFVNLEESTADIRANAATLGVDLDDVHFLDLRPESAFFAEDRSYDVFTAAEVEESPLTERIGDRIEELEPDRVFVDPLSQLRYLSSDEYQFRKQVLSFMSLISDTGSTILFTTQSTSASPDEDLQFMSDGTIELARTEAGGTLRVRKFRGSDFHEGPHAVRIGGNGFEVFPELRPDTHGQSFVSEPIPFGVPELDELLDGGLERGTVTIISGPTGVGKTTTGTQFMKEAAGRGERSVIYLFEEARSTFLDRSKGINIPVDRMLDRGNLRVEEVEPVRLAPQEFAQRVRREVEASGAEIVMIDGISGYRVSLHGREEELTTRLHRLNRYLKNMGVTVILIDELPQITGEFEATDVGMSYLADNIVFLRHLEFQGELRKVIGVLKKRTSTFERTLREFEITSHGLKVGEPITGLHGILSGTPQWDESAVGGLDAHDD